MSNHATLITIDADTAELNLGGPGESVHTSSPIDLRSLLELARRYRVTHLWVGPNSGVAPSQSEIEALQQEYDLFPVWRETKVPGRVAPLTSLYARRINEKSGKSAYNPVMIAFTEYSSWNFCKLPLNSAAFFEAVREIEAGLAEQHVQMTASPAGTGMKFFRNRNVDRKHLLKAVTMDITALPFIESAKPLVWDRKPIRDELDGDVYLHYYDRNGSHARAAMTEQFGVGDPVHRVGGDFVRSEPGIWRVLLGGEYPHQLNPKFPLPTWDNPGWLATPVVRNCVQAGLTVQVQASWTWPKGSYQPILRTTTEDLIRLRTNASTPLVGQAWKSIFNDFIGCLRRNRPDMYATIVASARAAFWSKAYTLSRDLGMYPIAAEIDAWYYLSRDPNPETAVPGMMSNATSIGGYKCLWSLPIQSEAKTLLLSDMGRSRKFATLKEMANGGAL